MPVRGVAMTATVDDVRIPPTRVEAPLTLAEEPPRVLGWLDQIGLWGNLGMSILGPVTAIAILQPYGLAQMSYLGAAVAIVVGTILGTLMVAAAAVPGAETGAPSMVLLRGLFGRRLSYLPTVVNVVQLVGWSVFEIVVIAAAAQQLLPWHAHRWPYVVIGGVLTTVMAIRPLGVVRILRRYALVLVAVTTVYLYVELLRHPLPSLTHGSWAGFWPGADYAVAAAVSFAPLASDYTRHARSTRSAFGATMIGYTVTQSASYILGLVALVLHINDYANFLALLGSVFVPLTAVLLVDYFLGRRHRWDVSESAPARVGMVVPWLAGFVVYQLINPGYVGWWVDRWTSVQSWLHFTPQTWMSASVLSFAVSAALTLPVTLSSRRRMMRLGSPRTTA